MVDSHITLPPTNMYDVTVKVSCLLNASISTLILYLTIHGSHRNNLRVAFYSVSSFKLNDISSLVVQEHGNPHACLIVEDHNSERFPTKSV